jgi:putative acetyltransferase
MDAKWKMEAERWKFPLAGKPKRAILEVVTILHANSAALVEEARRLFHEYAADIRVDLCFQNFDEELASLPGKYAPPQGALLLARESEQVAGCVALRTIEDGVCEMKRLYVRPAFRGSGIGRALAVGAMNEARQIGYRTMRLDTLAWMKPAIALYGRLGFRRIDAYCYNPQSDAVYMELALR